MKIIPNKISMRYIKLTPWTLGVALMTAPFFCHANKREFKLGDQRTYKIRYESQAEKDLGQSREEGILTEEVVSVSDESAKLKYTYNRKAIYLYDTPLDEDLKVKEDFAIVGIKDGQLQNVYINSSVLPFYTCFAYEMIPDEYDLSKTESVNLLDPYHVSTEKNKVDLSQATKRTFGINYEVVSMKEIENDSRQVFYWYGKGWMGGKTRREGSLSIAKDGFINNLIVTMPKPIPGFLLSSKIASRATDEVPVKLTITRKSTTQASDPKTIDTPKTPEVTGTNNISIKNDPQDTKLPTKNTVKTKKKK